jgi:hypothetical protein
LKKLILCIIILFQCWTANSSYTISQTREIVNDMIRNYLVHNKHESCGDVDFEIRHTGEFLEQGSEIYHHKINPDCHFSFDDLPRNFYHMAVYGIDRLIIIDQPGIYRPDAEFVRARPYLIHPDTPGNVSIITSGNESVFFMPSENVRLFCRTSREECHSLNDNRGQKMYPSWYHLRNLENLLLRRRDLDEVRRVTFAAEDNVSAATDIPDIDEFLCSDRNILDLGLNTRDLRILTWRLIHKLKNSLMNESDMTNSDRNKIFCIIFEYYLSQPFSVEMDHMIDDMLSLRIDGERMRCNGRGL